MGGVVVATHFVSANMTGMHVGSNESEEPLYPARVASILAETPQNWGKLIQTWWSLRIILHMFVLFYFL